MVNSTFPSRDELRSLIQSLEDASKNYDDVVSASGTAARSKLVGLAKDLINQLRDPMDMADAHIANANELVAIRTCLHLRVFHAIPFPGNASLDEIAVKTSAKPALLERLLRILVCTGFLLSTEPFRYAHTKHSYAYTLIPGPGMFFQLVYDESFLMIDNLHMYLSEKGYDEPLDQRYSPYAWKSKQEGTAIWEIMAQHPERLHAFQAGLAHADASIPLLGYYDFGQLAKDAADRTIMVDVGGGAGHVIAQILEAYPFLDPTRFVLQDLPPVLKKAAENELLPKQVQLMQHDFFTEQPVKGAKAYFLRRVLHDYSDPFSTDILSKLVPAMSHDSRILIADLMFPEHVTSNELGIASFDITMFNMGGKERTEACFRQILDDSGCELVKVWRSGFGFGVIVEARLKGASEGITADEPVLERPDANERTTLIKDHTHTASARGDIGLRADIPEPNGISAPVEQPAFASSSEIQATITDEQGPLPPEPDGDKPRVYKTPESDQIEKQPKVPHITHSEGHNNATSLTAPPTNTAEDS